MLRNLEFLALLSAGLVTFTLGQSASQGNVTCPGTGMDWYTSVNGETPCQTYARLRQICNNGYTVPTLSTNTPGDRCDDQVADCCCNSVAFALSMLCLNCQQGIPIGGAGFDAGAGAYFDYVARPAGTCQPWHNQSLGAIQQAVCNEALKIENDLYGLFWVDGSWFYAFTRDTITKSNLINNNNTFTNCASTTVANSSSSVPAGSSTKSSSSSSAVAPSGSTSSAGSSTESIAASATKSSFSGGAIGGIVAGVIVLVLVGLGVIYWVYGRRRLYTENQYNSENSPHRSKPVRESVYQVEPFLPSTHSQAPNGSGLHTSSNETSERYRDADGQPVSVNPSSSGYAGSGSRPSSDGRPTPRKMTPASHSRVTSSAGPGGSEQTTPMTQNFSLPIPRGTGPFPRESKFQRHDVVSGVSGQSTSPPPLQRPLSDPASVEPQMSEEDPREIDAGPYAGLARSQSGRLPPAYGEQRT